MRLFFQTSFQMRMLQQEYIAISDGLKKSLQQQMKFEITERIISNSKTIFFLRLYMIKYYEEKRQAILAKDENSPDLKTWSTERMGNEYKTIIFSLINGLAMAHHEPGNKVITENDNV